MTTYTPQAAAYIRAKDAWLDAHRSAGKSWQRRRKINTLQAAAREAWLAGVNAEQLRHFCAGGVAFSQGRIDGGEWATV